MAQFDTELKLNYCQNKEYYTGENCEIVITNNCFCFCMILSCCKFYWTFALSAFLKLKHFTFENLMVHAWCIFILCYYVTLCKILPSFVVSQQLHNYWHKIHSKKRHLINTNKIVFNFFFLNVNNNSTFLALWHLYFCIQGYKLIKNYMIHYYGNSRGPGSLILKNEGS